MSPQSDPAGDFQQWDAALPKDLADAFRAADIKQLEQWGDEIVESVRDGIEEFLTDKIKRHKRLKRNSETMLAALDKVRHVYEKLAEAEKNPQDIPVSDEMREMGDEMIKGVQELDAIFIAAETGDVDTLKRTFGDASRRLHPRTITEALETALKNNQTEAAEYLGEVFMAQPVDMESLEHTVRIREATRSLRKDRPDM